MVYDIKKNTNHRGYHKLNVIVLLVCITPIILSFLYIFIYGVNVVFWDQWETVVIFDKIVNSTFNLTDLLIPHNEHIIFFPHIFIILIAFLVKYNNIVEMCVVLILLFSILLIIFFYFKKKYRSKFEFFLFIPIPFLIFSLRQYENMLWGWQITFIFPLFFCIITFYFINNLSETGNIKSNIISFVSAIFLGTIATYSSMMGILIWPVVFFQMLISSIKKRRRFYFILIWICIGSIEYILYFSLLKKFLNVSDINFIINPLDILKGVFLLIGNSLFSNYYVALIMGIVILIILIGNIVILKKK